MTTIVQSPVQATTFPYHHPNSFFQAERNLEKRASLLEAEIQEMFLEQDTISLQKITPVYNLIYFLLPRDVILKKLNDPDSAIRKAIFIYHSYHPEEIEALKGSSNPEILKSTIAGHFYNLGVSKRTFKNEYYHTTTDDEGIVRERLNYLLSPNCVPETFETTTDGKVTGTFQLFLEDYTTLDKALPCLRTYSLDAKNIREIAMAQVIKIDQDLSSLNMMAHLDSNNVFHFKSIDGSHILPAELTGHRFDPLLENAPLMKPLLAPFTKEEEEMIVKTDIVTIGRLLEYYNIDESAVKINKCALLMLKEAVRWNKTFKEKIDLRDLLVILYISNPIGRNSDIGYLPAKETLFYRIAEAKDESDQVIIGKIRNVFTTIQSIKSSSHLDICHPDPTMRAINNHYATFPSNHVSNKILGIDF